MSWDSGEQGLTFSKFNATVIAPAPRRKSLAMATQSLPAIAMTDPPLWSIIDYQKEGKPYVQRPSNVYSAPFLTIEDGNEEIEVGVNEGMVVNACAYLNYAANDLFDAYVSVSHPHVTPVTHLSSTGTVTLYI
jgi:hypothetical protein